MMPTMPDYDDAAADIDIVMQMTNCNADDAAMMLVTVDDAGQNRIPSMQTTMAQTRTAQTTQPQTTMP